MLQYGNSGSNRISLTFFDSGRRRVSRDFATREVISSSEIILAIARGQGRTEGNVHFTDDDLPVRGAVAASLIHVGKTKNSLGNDYLMIGIIDNCMYKLRYTTGGSSQRADKKFYKLLQDLAEHLGPDT